ncbi:MAG: hypothetical protein R3Y33_01460 [Clostridia bacterium]
MKKFIKRLASCFIIINILICSVSFTATASTTSVGFEFPYENLLCESIYVKEVTTDNVIFTQDENIQTDVSSLAMIMTAVVAIENLTDIDNTLVTFTQDVADVYNNTAATAISINVGDQLTILDYLNVFLVCSDVESALQVAFYYNTLQGYISEKTGIDEYSVDLRATDMTDSPFVQKMNETAEKIGCENTYFTNATGYHSDEAYSTAYDMALILEYAMSLPYFNDIVKKSSYTTSATASREDGYKVYLTNPLFSLQQYEGRYYNKYAVGAKTGVNTIAGNCIAVSATDGDYVYIVIALGAALKDEFGNTLDSNGAASDATRLVNWCFTSISKRAVFEESALISEVEIRNAWGQDTVQLVSAENVIALLPDDVLSSHLDIYVDTPDYIEAPVSKGDVIAEASIYYEGRYITSVDVVAKESVGRSQLLSVLEKIIFVITLPQFYLILGLIFAAVFAYVLFMIRINKNKSKRKKVVNIEKIPPSRKRNRNRRGDK